MSRYVADGTTIARSNSDSPETFTDIPQVATIGDVGQTRALIDTTNLSSAAREYLKAIKDGQEIELGIQYDPGDSTHAALRTDRDSDSDTGVKFRVTLTNSPAQTITFFAMVIDWTINGIQIDNVLLLRVVLKPTGDLTFA